MRIEEIKIRPEIVTILEMNNEILNMNKEILKRIFNPMLIIDEDKK